MNLLLYEQAIKENAAKTQRKKQGLGMQMTKNQVMFEIFVILKNTILYNLAFKIIFISMPNLHL